MRVNSLALLLLASLLIVLPSLCSASRLKGGYDPEFGRWTPIEDPNDPHIVEIGRYAVSQHNRVTNSKLEFCRVISGQTLNLVVGTWYKLVIEAKDGDKVGNYEALVWEKGGEKLVEVTSFEPLQT